MRITSHAVGAVIVRVESDGRVMVKQMSYTNDRGTTWRHMMESGEGETVLETLRNGLLDEVAADKKGFDYRLIKPEPILVEFCRDQKDASGTHMKTFFLVEHLRGEFRSTAKPDGSATMGPIKECEVRGLVELTRGKTIPIHYNATVAAIGALASDRRVFDRYQELILTAPQQGLSDDQRTSIAEYPGRW